jgi:hypothetical protein
MALIDQVLDRGAIAWRAYLLLVVPYRALSSRYLLVDYIRMIAVDD